ncbi:MAG: peptidylprolyl isomerase [Rhodothermaceae bacterium]|nr:peptidylprolyl isomerase [Rhodothermaceae bacterium]
MRRILYILLYVFAIASVCLVCIGCGQAFSENRGDEVRGIALAEVNGESIMSETFREGYLSYLLKTGLQDKPEYRRHFVNSQIASLLLVQEAKKAGIESSQDFQEAKKRIRKKLLVDIYVRKALFDQLEVSDDDLKDMFARAKTILTARHLYAPTKERADELYRQLERGATFEELAKEVFSDTILANNGGLIGEFSVDDMDVAFEEAAYQLKVGQISQPVRTAQGYSIIKVEDRFTKPLITEYEYAESKDRMLQFVLYRKKTKARKAHAAQLIQEVSPEYNAESFNRLYGLVAGSARIQTNEELNAWIDERLVSFSGTAGEVVWTLSAFQAMASETSEEQRSRVRSEEDLKSFIDALIVREEMAGRSERRGFNEDPEFVYEMEKAMHNWIWSDAVSKLKQGVAVSEDTLQAYYLANQKNFASEPEVEIFEILVDSKKKADEVKEHLRMSSFESVAASYSIRPGADKQGGRLGYLRSKQLGVLWKHVADAKSGDVLGPIKVDDHYVYLKVGARKESGPDTSSPDLEEIRNQYLVQHGSQLVMRHVEALKEESTISIDESLLSSLAINTPFSLPEYSTN